MAPRSHPQSAHKRKGHSTDFLSQLQMLREFVGDTYPESDLSACLRQCGCNIQLAAERLITGQFKQAPSDRQDGGKASCFFAMSTTSPSKPSSTAKRPRITPLTAPKKAPPAQPVKRNSLSLSSSKKTPPPPVPPTLGRHLWLCQRWVVGLCTTKNGHARYKEPLAISHSLTGPPMVRFRGKDVEGTLRPNVCALLTPLLRHETPLISLEAEALMEEESIPMGGDVPVAVRVFIEDPVAFFGLFEDHSISESAASQYFGKLNKKKARGRQKKIARLPIAEAAFCLLQWAEYGDDPTFEPPPQDEAKEENDEDVVEMGEDEFEAEAASGEANEKDAPEWAKTVVDSTVSGGDAAMGLPEASDPVGFLGDVELRPYQRQALHWMLNRERGDDSREDLEKELTLLSELSRKAARPSVTIEPVTDQDILCEVGPVRVSPSAALASRTIDGVQNPVNHPLWQRRFLASRDKESAISFYVNELLGIASSKPPNPPRHCVGGILADAMGLGKTVMLLALILKDKELSEQKEAADAGDTNEAVEDDEVVVIDGYGSAEKQARQGGGTTLVIAPLSLVSQWEEELATKTSLTHRVYYAETAKGKIRADSFQGVDVVVTTYGTIQGELSSSLKGASSDTGLLSYDWHRLILDEAHCIKNPATIVSRACCMLKAENRWCVTGTPIQNSLQDVYALLKFLKHEPWCEGGFWKAAITGAAAVGDDDYSQEAAKSSGSAGVMSSSPPKAESPQTNVALNRVRRLLAPLILRRTKESVNKDGQPILTLPPVETITVSVELSAPEREFYTSLMQRSQSLFEGFMKEGTASKSWFQIFSLLNRLRQACDHVALTVKSHMEDAEWNPARLEAALDKKKPASPAASRPKKSSIDKDALGEEFLGGLLEKFRTKQSFDKENVELHYASQVAHALAKSVKSNATTIEDECPICLDCPKIAEAVITPCAHIFCRSCLVGILKNNATSQSTIRNALQCPDGKCPSCNEMIEAKRIIMLSKSSEDGRMTTSYLTSSKTTTKIDRAEAQPKEESSHLVARQTLEKALRGAGSAKLSAIINELHKVWEQDPRSKVLIFSQYLGFLDLLEASLRNESIPFGRLDGKMSLKERVSVLENFRNGISSKPNGDVESRIGSVLLMSMKAGGVGINMTAASSVFIADPWYNAAVEDQCVSRIHRIGQQAELVRVRKFVVKDSVEERIVLLQRRKKDMACEVLSDVNADGVVSNSAPTLDDFKLLFQS